MADGKQYKAFGDASTRLKALEILEKLDAAGALSTAERTELDQLRASQKADVQGIEATEAQYRGAAQGASIGLADEAGAAARSAVGAFTGGPSYSEELSSIREKNDFSRENYPEQFNQGKFVGGITSSLLPFGLTARALQGAGLGVNMLAGGALGGGLAALTDFNEGRNGPVNRLKNIKPANVGIGAGVGVSAPVTGRIVGRMTADGVTNPAPNTRSLGVRKRPAKILTRAMNDDAQVQSDVEAYLKGLGKEAMPLDAGRNMQMLAGSATATPGSASAQIVKKLDQRAAQSAKRVENDLNSVAGPVEDQYAAYRQNRINRGKAASPLYDEAKKSTETMDTAEILDEIDRLQKLGAPGSEGLSGVRPMLLSERKTGGGVPIERTIDAEPAPRARHEEAAEIADMRAEIEAYDREYTQAASDLAKSSKRPVSAIVIARGGIAPDSPAASDLRAMGVTPQTMPGLFRKNGMKDLDNLTEVLGVKSDGFYADRQSVIDRIADEQRLSTAGRGGDPELRARLEELDQVSPYIDDLRERLPVSPDPVPFPGDNVRLSGEMVPETSVLKLHYQRSKISDQIRAARNAGLVNEALHLESVLKAMDDQLDKVEGYQTARRIWGESKSVDEARDLGAKVFTSPDADRTKDEMLGLYSEHEKEAFRSAARKGLGLKVDRSPSPDSAAARNMRPKEVQKTLDALFGPGSGAKMDKRQEAEAAFANSRTRAAYGSDTAARQSARKEIEPMIDADGVRIGPVRRAKGAVAGVGNSIVDALMGKPRGSDDLASLASALTAQGARRDEIVRALLSDGLAQSRNKKIEDRVQSVIQTLIQSGATSAY